MLQLRTIISVFVIGFFLDVLVLYFKPFFLSTGMTAVLVHSILTLLGVIVGFCIYVKLCSIQKLKHSLWTGFFALLFGFVFARMFYYFGPWHGQWQDFFTGLGGMVLYGGLLGGFVGVYIYCWLKDLNAWKFFDCGIIGMAAALFIARIGCFLVNDGPGTLTTLPWGVHLPTGLSHPTHIYSSLFHLGLFCFLLYHFNKKQFDGKLALQGIMLYAVGRFLLEFIRLYDVHLFSLTISQWISIGVFVLAFIACFDQLKFSKIQKDALVFCFTLLLLFPLLINHVSFIHIGFSLTSSSCAQNTFGDGPLEVHYITSPDCVDCWRQAFVIHKLKRERDDITLHVYDSRVCMKEQPILPHLRIEKETVLRHSGYISYDRLTRIIDLS